MSTFLRLSGLLLAASLPLSAYAELPAERIEPSINAELAAHTKVFAQQLYRVADNVYSAVGWQLGNVVMIEAPEGLIIVDTGESVSESRKIMAEFRKITDKPVKAVVYTHFHPDHINGVQAFVTREQVESGDVQIYAHDTLLANVVAQGALVGPILGVRSAYSFGSFLEAQDEQDMNGGIGPLVTPEPSTFIAPTVTFADKLDTTIAGLDVQFLHVPSEAPDEIVLYLPANRVLISAEVDQGADAAEHPHLARHQVPRPGAVGRQPGQAARLPGRLHGAAARSPGQRSGRRGGSTAHDPRRHRLHP